METKLKELEREKRVNAAKRNLMLAESKVKLNEQKVKEFAQNNDVSQVHEAAAYRMLRIELDHAERDLEVAKKQVITAEVDPDDLDEILEYMFI